MGIIVIKTLYTERAYAKINLWLDVIDKRDDGYHNIKSVMQTVSLYDIVSVGASDENINSMTCTGRRMSCGKDNLCMKSAAAFYDASGNIPGENVRISLKKVIPTAAGLGGGSADAAAVLRAMNSLYRKRFTESELLKIASGIGADVPFCVRGGAAIATGTGEILERFPRLTRCHIVLSGGIGHIRTPEAYAKIDSCERKSHGDFDAFRNAYAARDPSEIAKHLYNRFEDVTENCVPVKNILSRCGASGSLMSGSGPSVFGIFTDFTTAAAAAEELKKAKLRVWIVQPI